MAALAAALAHAAGTVVWGAALVVAAAAALVLATRAAFFGRRSAPSKASIAFFHPYWCAAAGVGAAGGAPQARRGA